ncbi:MAG: hypothetical protein WC460_00820 [Patescibacteria group bacterium]
MNTLTEILNGPNCRLIITLVIICLTLFFLLILSNYFLLKYFGNKLAYGYINLTVQKNKLTKDFVLKFVPQIGNSLIFPIIDEEGVEHLLSGQITDLVLDLGVGTFEIYIDGEEDGQLYIMNNTLNIFKAVRLLQEQGWEKISSAA